MITVRPPKGDTAQNQGFDSLILATFDPLWHDFRPNWSCLCHMVTLFGISYAHMTCSEQSQGHLYPIHVC